jgi:hypothetical protein
LRGPLASLVDYAPSPDNCRLEATRYAKPFWHAPYRRCVDSDSGGHQVVVLDAESLVVETHHDWVAAPQAQQVSWNREAARLTRLFGPPVRSANAASHLAADVAQPNAMLRSYCEAWRGPDRSEIVLRLDPTTDAGSPTLARAWNLRRDSRYGPLADAVACIR